MSELPCARRQGVPHGQTESGGIVLAVICAGPEAVLPDRALYLPTFSHFLIVNKTSLSLSLSLTGQDACPGPRTVVGLRVPLQPCKL
jgi:hypothetical protein